MNQNKRLENLTRLTMRQYWEDVRMTPMKTVIEWSWALRQINELDWAKNIAGPTLIEGSEDFQWRKE